ncbi:DUF4139 domain-containing protein [Sulfuriferula sp. AH1]|uniref:DUF4139 domain-containing protein n=1 Tax=Sulfuriferula sp. AH1 TaxID=1985873 RepID=UPI000B3B718D|nr:DUF4139 domain-containing protein [Sulfuriferula sp. AH1]
MSRKWLGLGLMLWVVGANAAMPVEETTTLADQRALALTIYNDDLALVKEQRRVNLPAGTSRLAWRDVSARIRPETALLRSLNEANGLRLLEQNFDFDVLTPQKLLEKNVGNTVTVIKTNPATGMEVRETATVLAANDGVVLKFADRIETGVPGRLAFAAVPDNLRDRPTLVMTLANARSGVPDLELSYLTGGLSWRADYVAELSANEDKLDINAWVTLTNQSGVSYPNARLQFVAGDVNRVREDLRPGMAARGGVVMAKAAEAPMAQENLFEYHLYSLGRTTTLADQQTKQVALLSALQVPVRKSLELRGAEYYYQGSYGDLGKKLKAGVFIEFDNKGAGLGVPLPKGVMRVYKRDGAGNAQFVGEDGLDHTARNDTVRLKLGDAFDVYADKKQTDFQKISGGRNYTFESAYQITLHNAKSEAVMVKVYEPIPGDWQIINASATHSKAAAGMALWQLRIPAESSTVLTYRVRVKL